MKRIIFAALVGVLVSGPAAAKNPQGEFQILGYGVKTCGFWLIERRKSKSSEALSMVTWITGFISAVNLYVEGKKDFTSGTDLVGLSAWIDNYCQEKPHEELAKASAELIFALRTN